MKLISWNVNGLRACLGKGFLEYFDDAGRGRLLPAGDQAAGRGRSDLALPGYQQYWN